MATSGIYTLTKTQTELIDEALETIQATGDGETIQGDSFGRAKKLCNRLIKEWSTSGMHLWSYTEGTLFLDVGQEKYDFTSSAEHVVNTWYETTTTAATSASATTIPVTSAANIQVTDPIGVIQNDNDLFWTTVKEVSGTNIIVNDAITLATVSGAKVRNYRVGTTTSPALIPISRVLDVRRLETDYEIPIVFESRQDYFNLPNKTTTGTPIQAYYDRQDIAGETSGVMYLWPAPASSVPVINFTYERKLQILNNPTDEIDVPDFALDAFIYNLAVRLIPVFGCSGELAIWVKSEAERLKNDLLAYDSDIYPVKMRMKRYG